MTVEQHAEAAAKKLWAMTDMTFDDVTAAIDEATAPLRARIDLLTAEIARMEAEVKYANGERIRVQDAIHKIDRDIIQTLGKALHYPWFKDDQKNFPGATEADGVAVGDHVAETLAVEAAKRIEKLEGLGPLIEEILNFAGDVAAMPVDAGIEEYRRKIDAILKGGA